MSKYVWKLDNETNEWNLLKKGEDNFDNYIICISDGGTIFDNYQGKPR